MTDTYARLRALFDHCVDLPEGEREQWLDENVVGTDLRIELELMLAADRGAAGFLGLDVAVHIDRFGAAAIEGFTPQALIGRRFGAFQLQRLLGQGGQGTVFLAERVDGDFAQTAAVKLLRRGIHDSNEHRRFRREREILARFEDAGVARLIDGGISGDGVPYLVMEYVEGVPIDRWCEDKALDPRGCVELIGKLCEIVSAAHRALIVHRDLKPSNVLVTPTGAIKVLDFGIARLLDEEESTLQTAGPLMTPGYGAPEQALGGAITLSTDVHALGMLLRVLLTRSPPPVSPAEVSRWPLQLPLELRWIIAKACAIESEQRYRDAAELVEDLQRYLTARPVHAHPPSRWYTARKFLHRHRGGVLTTFAVLLGILASASFALWQARIAREQAQRAEAARDFLLGVFESAKEELPRDARPTPDTLVRAAAKKLDIDQRLSPALRAELLGTLSTISSSSNDYEQAITLAERGAAVLLEAGAGGSREMLAFDIQRANALIQLGKFDDADRLLGERIVAIREISDEVAINGIDAYGATRLQTGHADESLALARESFKLAQAVFGSGSEKSLIAAANFGDYLAVAGYFKEAVDVLEPALAEWRASAIPPDHRLANSIQNLSVAKYQLGDIRTSETLQRESLALLRQIYTPPHESIADALYGLGTLLRNADNDDEAEKVMQEAASMYATLFGPLHPQNAGMQDALGSLELARQQPAKAIEHFLRATGICTEAKLETNPLCAVYWQNLSVAYLRTGRLEEAEAANLHGLELRRTLLGEQHPSFAGSLAGRASVLVERGKPEPALASINQALAISTAAGRSESLGGAVMRRTRAMALNQLHRTDEALAMLDEADALALRLEPDNTEYRFSFQVLRAEILSDAGRDAEAHNAARAALAMASKRGMISDARWQRIEALAR
ncbi:MAG: serine/threonine protein kinase [Xanthomonadales bacterium]|nr:serine/threonine protein kinase [Xanthomonadales bacterium]